MSDLDWKSRTSPALPPESASQRDAASVLAEAAAIIGGTDELDGTLAALARCAIPAVADGCAASVLAANGQVLRVAWAHDDGELAERIERLARASGVPERAVAERRAIVAELAGCAVLAAPMIARGGPRGAMTFWTRPGKALAAAEQQMAEQLAGFAGLAVDAAYLLDGERRASRALEDFLSMVTHELRSPIAALRLQVATLRRARDSAGEPQKVERMARQIERLSTLVQNLLDVTRIASGGMGLDLEEVELGEVVRDTLEKLQPEVALRAAAIQLHQPVPIRGRWDRVRLEQIATNLLSNAIKYGEAKPIDVWLERRTERAVLAVQDRGLGIAPEKLERLFGRFERVAMDARIPGVGLGLWIVRNITEAMGGTVAVESHPGLGSTFIVDLPLRCATS